MAIRELRPLCRTRYGKVKSYTVSFESAYDAILSALEQTSQLKTEAATRASGQSGLLVKFQHGNTYMALTMAEDTLGQLETLNISLQSKMMTMSDMKAANDGMVKSLDTKQTSNYVAPKN